MDSGTQPAVHLAFRFHVNLVHSYRGDTADEQGFGKDIRVIRGIVRMLDEVEMMAWNNGLVSAHTAAGFDAAVSRAISRPTARGSGTRRRGIRVPIPRGAPHDLPEREQSTR